MAKEYIDKEAVGQAVLELPSKVDEDGYIWVLRRDAFHAVDNFPAANVRENVKGEWIQHYETTSDNETLLYGWECSLCGRWEMEKQPFCNCGAKMEVQDG